MSLAILDDHPPAVFEPIFHRPVPLDAIVLPAAASRNHGNAPLVLIDDGLHARAPDGHYRPLRHLHDGSAIRSLLPGWQASWICNDFAPLHLIELIGPEGRQATWFVDDAGQRLGDRVPDLPAEQQSLLSAGRMRLLAGRDPDILEARSRYARLCEATRLEIDLLVPNASDDRGLELAQAAAARPGVILHTAAHVDAASPARLATELVAGWRISELDGHPVCMAVGSSSVIRLSNIPRSTAYYVALNLGPLRVSRRLRVSVNGRLIAVNPLSSRFHRSHARFGYWIPPELVASGVIEITLEHAPVTSLDIEAFVLEGVRLDLGEPVEDDGKPDPLADGELMQRFQSIGDNCQFGFVQRHFGVEPMGLLRFAGVGAAGVPEIVRLIESGLAGLGDAGTVGYFMAGREYMIRETSHHLFYHTFRYADQVSAHEVIAENEIKLRYLARKFTEDLEDGEKIWVFRRMVSTDVSEILALHAAMRRFGPNRLLWITPARDDRRAGEVEFLSTGLLRGYLAADAANEPGSFDPEHWRLVCRRAEQAFRTH